jgi:hypothetical protein
MWWQVKDFQRCLDLNGYAASCKWPQDKVSRDWPRLMRNLGYPVHLCLKRAGCEKASLDCSRPLQEISCSTCAFLAVMLDECVRGRDMDKSTRARAVLRSWLQFFLGLDWEAALHRDKDAKAIISVGTAGQHHTWLAIDQCEVCLHSLLDGAFPLKDALKKALDASGISGGSCHLIDLMVFSCRPKFYWLLRPQAAKASQQLHQKQSLDYGCI